MKNRIILSLIILTCIFSLCACGKSSTTTTIDTDTYREISITDDESSQLLEDLVYFIEGMGDGSSLQSFDENLTMDSDDILNGLVDANIEYYLSNNAAYVKVNTTMFRFQFNSEGKVESYIKYSVEA